MPLQFSALLRSPPWVARWIFMLEVDIPPAESEVWMLHVLHWIFRSSVGLLAPFRDYRFPGIGDKIKCVHNNSFCSLPRGKDGEDRWDIPDDPHTGNSFSWSDSTGELRFWPNRLTESSGVIGSGLSFRLVKRVLMKKRSSSSLPSFKRW
jgi:hypothetical protein